MVLLFYLSVVAALVVVVGVSMIAADPGQMLFGAPRAWGMALLTRRRLLMVVSGAAFVVSMVVGIVYQVVGWPLLMGYGLFFVVSYFASFLASEMLFFPDLHHKNAEYRPLAEISGVADDEDVFVVQDGDEAYAFPREWIVRPHIAGVRLGGEDVAVAYCGLSHVALAFRDEVDGRPLDFRTTAQFENNLVLRDAVSGDVVQLIYGELVKQGRPLDQVPVTTMPFKAFKALYPEGRVFYHPPQGVLDRTIRRVLKALLYGEGRQYDPATPRLIFNTITYRDTRVPPKEMVYGLAHDGQAVAYTVPYLSAHDNVVVEKVGEQTVTVKYFDEYDFVGVFAGDVPDVGPTGVRADGSRAERVPHAGKLMWLVWRNFYPETAVHT